MKTLKQLQDDNLPRATCEGMGLKLGGDDSAIERGRRIMDAYFIAFLSPACEIGDPLASASCIRCERPLDGIFGTFIWGMCNGEGYCSECKYPARARHRILDGKGEVFATLSSYVLQYHPSALTEDTELIDAEGQVCRVG